MTIKTTHTFAREIKRVTGEPIRRHFYAHDTKGRQFGAKVFPYACEYELYESECWGPPRPVTVEAGRIYYCFQPQAMRGNASFGSSQQHRRFDTLEQRRAAIEAYFATAEKGALKNKARAA